MVYRPLRAEQCVFGRVCLRDDDRGRQRACRPQPGLGPAAGAQGWWPASRVHQVPCPVIAVAEHHRTRADPCGHGARRLHTPDRSRSGAGAIDGPECPLLAAARNPRLDNSKVHSHQPRTNAVVRSQDTPVFSGHTDDKTPVAQVLLLQVLGNFRRGA